MDAENRAHARQQHADERRAGRGIVDEVFRRRAVLDMETRILAIAGELFAEGSPTDLVDRYALKLPLSVICELLGLPLTDRPKFTAWAGYSRVSAGPLVSSVSFQKFSP